MNKSIVDIQPISILDGFEAQFIHTENLTISYVNVKAGSVLPEHSHYNEQISEIIYGEFELTIGGKTNRYKSGMVAIIPSNVVHSGRAITDCKITDVFSPAREDYKALS